MRFQGLLLSKINYFPILLGIFTGFTIKDINNLIELDLFQSLTISTYNDGLLQEVKTGGDLISISLLTPILGSGSGFYNVGFKVSSPFDERQIRVASLRV